MKLPNVAVRRLIRGFESADFGGDRRRTQRLKRVVSRLAKRPTATLPQAMGSESELEAMYRFANNPRVTMQALMQAYAADTARRASQQPLLLAIHDTTSVECPHAPPEEVGYLNTGKPGFYAHYSLIVGAISRRPLGIANLETISRPTAPRRRRAKAPKRSNKSGAQTRKKPNREFERWERGISITETRMHGCPIIHVADRESDSFELIAQCLEAQRRFVFRVRLPSRNAQGVGGESGSLGELAARAKGVLTREIAISTRKSSTAPKTAKAHPPRMARLATLQFSATPLQLRRPHYLGLAFPAAVPVHVVRVWEPNPPQGAEPVQWLLITTEPIETKADVEAIVDMYRARWLIEECNKALKTGCQIESREFESLHAMLVMLALSLPIACEILALRTATREDPDRPAIEVLDRTQIEILRRVGSRKLPANPTARDALLAVAALGGHQRSNGDPGWQVLLRGMTELHAYTVGWDARGRSPALRRRLNL
jgi:hypothetical protein